VKLCTYLRETLASPRIAVSIQLKGSEYLVDAAHAYALFLRRIEGERFAARLAAARIPGEMLAALDGGDKTLQAIRQGTAFVIELLVLDERLQELIEAGVVLRRSAVQLLAPIPRPRKVVAIGANYREHVREGQATGALGDIPSYPPAFLKMPSAVIGPDEPIVHPHFAKELDYEVEFSIVIGAYCKDVAKENWLDVVVGFTIVNDLSLRDLILEEKKSGIVFAGKNFATSCPMGPYIVTKDELHHPDDLAVSLRVNGQIRQQDRTSSMVHNCAAIVSYWSKLGLEPGDVLTTGTPGGGAGFNRRFPERLLKPGDMMEAEVEGIGVLRNSVVAEPATASPDHPPAASMPSVKR
jgi:acylpyruvate hydrolase